MVWNSFSHCVRCTVREDPVTSDFALARKARLVHGIPVTIYNGFVVSKRTSLTPRGNPIALCLGFLKTAPTIERIEQLLPEPKKVFDGVSFEASLEKGQPSNTSNGLGYSKG